MNGCHGKVNMLKAPNLTQMHIKVLVCNEKGFEVRTTPFYKSCKRLRDCQHKLPPLRKKL